MGDRCGPQPGAVPYARGAHSTGTHVHGDQKSANLRTRHRVSHCGIGPGRRLGNRSPCNHLALRSKAGFRPRDPDLQWGQRTAGLWGSRRGVISSCARGLLTYGNEGEGFTPNVLVDYFVGSPPPTAGVSLWEDGYGGLSNVLFGNQNSNMLKVRLTADAGFSALLYGFDLAGWPNADYTINAVRIFDTITPLYSQSSVPVEGNFTGPRHTSFSFATPLSGSDLLIEVDYSNLPGSQQNNIGIDNIRFGQFPGASVAVPEPLTGLLLLIGLCALSALVPTRSRPSARRSLLTSA